jgi:hypothetical protein
MRIKQAETGTHTGSLRMRAGQPLAHHGAVDCWAPTADASGGLGFGPAAPDDVRKDKRQR